MEVREPAIAYGKQKFTIEEYLAMEETAIEKHEYYKGEILAMSGTKMPHNMISKNLFIGLGIKLKGKKCQPYGSDMRVHIQANALFTYPEFPLFAENRKRLIMTTGMF